MPINEENVVMVDLDLSRGVISSSSKEAKDGTAIEEPTLFEDGVAIEEPMLLNTEEIPSIDEETNLIPKDRSYSEKRVEEAEMKEPESYLEPLSTAEPDCGSEEPTIHFPPLPKLTNISEDPLSSHEEDEDLSSLDKETEVEALLDGYSEEEKEKKLEETPVDLINNESQTPDPEIQQKLKESLPEEIRRLIYPVDYPKAEATESSPEKETTVPLNTAKAILK